jgi:hypothetical protein
VVRTLILETAALAVGVATLVAGAMRARRRRRVRAASLPVATPRAGYRDDAGDPRLRRGAPAEAWSAHALFGLYDRVPKRRVVVDMLDAHPAVFVVFDPRRTGVDCPDELRTLSALTFLYGRDVRPPIEGLDVGDGGIAAVLGFVGAARATYVPWSAVFAVSDPKRQHGTWWPEDMPADALGFPR